jgi:hypothetical protein
VLLFLRLIDSVGKNFNTVFVFPEKKRNAWGKKGLSFSGIPGLIDF